MQRFGERSAETLAANCGADDARWRVRHLFSVSLNFITESQLTEALACQVHEELNGKGHRLLGEILFEKEAMSASQIDQVMTELFKRMRNEQDAVQQSTRPL